MLALAGLCKGEDSLICPVPRTLPQLSVHQGRWQATPGPVPHIRRPMQPPLQS